MNPSREGKQIGDRLEWIWIAILPVVGLGVLVWIWIGLPVPKCPFRILTGLPCFTCGVTTGFRLLVAGSPAQAFFSNPLSLFVPGAAAVFWVYCLGAIFRWWGTISLSELPKKTGDALRVATVIFLTFIWVYMVARVAIPV